MLWSGDGVRKAGGAPVLVSGSGRSIGTGQSAPLHEDPRAARVCRRRSLVDCPLVGWSENTSIVQPAQEAPERLVAVGLGRVGARIPSFAPLRRKIPRPRLTVDAIARDRDVSSAVNAIDLDASADYSERDQVGLFMAQRTKCGAPWESPRMRNARR